MKLFKSEKNEKENFDCGYCGVLDFCTAKRQKNCYGMTKILKINSEKITFRNYFIYIPISLLKKRRF